MDRTHHMLGWIAAIRAEQQSSVFGRELRIASRRRGMYVLRPAYLLLVAGLLYVTWSGALQGLGSEEISTLGEGQAAAMGYVLGVSKWQSALLQILAVFLLSPGFNRDRQSGTLEVLLASPLSMRQIVLSRLAGQLMVMGVLVACYVPILMLLRGIASLPISAVLAIPYLTLLSVAIAGAVTLFVATGIRPGASAIGISILALLLLNNPLMMAAEVDKSHTIWAMISPNMGLALVDNWLRGEAVIGGGLFALAVTCPFGLLLVGLAVWTTGVNLRGSALRTPTVPKPVEQPPADSDEADTPAPPRAFTLGGLANRPRERWRNPIVSREFRPLFRLTESGKNTAAQATVIGCIPIMCVAIGLEGWTNGFGLGVVCTLLAVWLVMVAVTAGPSLAADRRSRVLPLMLLAPVSHRRIVLAKILGTLYRSRLGWIAAAIALGTVMAFQPHHIPGLLKLLAFAVGAATLAAGLGLRLGLALPGGAEVGIVTVLTLVALWGLPMYTVNALLPAARQTILIGWTPVPMMRDLFHETPRYYPSAAAATAWTLGSAAWHATLGAVLLHNTCRALRRGGR